MQRLAFDIETTPLPEADKVHLITIADLDAEEIQVKAFHDDPLLEREGTLAEGLALVEGAEEVVCHNGLFFDIPVLQEVLGLRRVPRVRDTLIASRLIYSDRRERDFDLWREKELEPRYIGSHSLASWGARLCNRKGDYTGDFYVLDEEMLRYGLQDTAVTVELWRHLEPQLPDFEVDGVDTLELEQQFAMEMDGLKKSGVRFDVEACHNLLAQLHPRRLKLEDELQKAFPPTKQFYARTSTGKRRRRRNAEGEMVDHKLVPFDPGSRLALARRLQSKYGWIPSKFTDDREKRPAMVEEVLLELAEMYPEAKLAAELYIVKARIGILEAGNGNYLDFAEEDGRIHGTTMHIGAISHRCSHSKPNLANPTSVRKPWGKEIRALFKPDEGMVMVGGDGSGLEQRMLAHYLGAYDGGSYANLVDDGDVHAMFQVILQSVGVRVDRNQTKTIEYAYLYGCGNDHLGKLCGGDHRTGRLVRQAFSSKIPGLGKLLASVEHFRKKNGCVYSLDKRRVSVRNKHSALNTLLQSAGAVVMKWQLMYLKEACEQKGIRWGVDYRPHLHVHDEVQGSLRPELLDTFKQAFEDSFARTQSALGVRIPLRCDVKHGESWLDTH